MDEDRREIDQKRFRFEASVNLAHILTTIGMLVALFKWGSDLNATVVTHGAIIAQLREDRNRAEQDVRGQLREINNKVDRLIEREFERVRR